MALTSNQSRAWLKISMSSLNFEFYLKVRSPSLLSSPISCCFLLTLAGRSVGCFPYLRNLRSLLNIILLSVELREGQREKDQKVLTWLIDTFVLSFYSLGWLMFKADFFLWGHLGFFDSSPAGPLWPKLPQGEQCPSFCWLWIFLSS